jgi:hypothetical protein
VGSWLSRQINREREERGGEQLTRGEEDQRRGGRSTP